MQEPVQPSTLRQFYAARRVLVTGHTGFKGGWLALWLARMGAQVYGFALPPDQGPDNLFERARVAADVDSSEVDLRDAEAVQAYVSETRPQIIFHLAARAWVQQGYEDPAATFAANTLGTVHVLEAARKTPSVEAVVCVTTDKVYRNREWHWPYRETDELGGLDPYSASKAAAELVARCYCHTLKPSDRPFALATARGGNVIGGGDWSPYRLVPDIVRAIRGRQPLYLRRPAAIRPWQHVLDLSYAYLLLGHRLSCADIEPSGADADDSAWNFGPVAGGDMTVAGFVSTFLESWGEPDYPIVATEPTHYESTTLRLDPSRAVERLGWRPVLDGAAAIEWTADWYRLYLDNASDARRSLEGQIGRFEAALNGEALVRRSPAQSPLAAGTHLS